MTLKTPLARVLGLGSAKDGVGHWWWQRLTAIAIVPLGIWFVLSVVSLAGAQHGAAVSWLQSPLNAALFLCFLLAAFWHASLGLQVGAGFLGATGARVPLAVVGPCQADLA